MNSGARIGLAQDIFSKFQVAWRSPSEPWKGFDYLFLAPKDYEEAKTNATIKAEPVKTPEGELRYRIIDM